MLYKINVFIKIHKTNQIICFFLVFEESSICLAVSSINIGMYSVPTNRITTLAPTSLSGWSLKMKKIHFYQLKTNFLIKFSTLSRIDSFLANMRSSVAIQTFILLASFLKASAPSSPYSSAE